MTILTKPCLLCGGTVVKKPSCSMRAWEQRTRYCSRDCANEAKRGKPHSPHHVDKIRRASTGRRHTQQTKERIRGENSHRWRGGKPKCADCGERAANVTAKRCMSCARKRMKGETSPNWQGGITPINAKARNAPEMIAWRRAVFERDDYTCQCCGLRGVELHADHIKPFALFPELRTVLSNGRTLCVRCHKMHGARVWGGRVVKEAAVIKAVAA